MQALKGVGLVLAGIAGAVALVFLIALYIAGLAWVSESVHEYLNIAATTAVAACVFILLPCALFRATRKVSVHGLLISSVIFGASTWILGFLVTLQYWGVFGILVGVILGIVGIVPLGMLASAFHSDWATIGMLAVGLVLTFGARMIAIMVAAWIDHDEAAGIGSNSPSVSLTPQPSRRVLVTVLGLVMVGSVGVWLSQTQRSQAFDPTGMTLDQLRAAGYTVYDPSGPFEGASGALNRGDYTTALRLMRPLADEGFPPAQTSLGFMYEQGKGVPQNHVAALNWYRLAAGKGDATAQYNLGAMYNNGRGVPQDYVLAHMWFNLSAAQGDHDAATWRDIVAMLMSPAQLAEAQKLAREWKPKFTPR